MMIAMLHFATIGYGRVLFSKYKKWGYWIYCMNFIIVTN
jgi:hypothetical protein